MLKTAVFIFNENKIAEKAKSQIAKTPKVISEMYIKYERYVKKLYTIYALYS